jgi:hypothetical protein
MQPRRRALGGVKYFLVVLTDEMSVHGIWVAIGAP